MQALLPPMRVCGECGVRAARRADRCAACGASALGARELRPDARMAWVRVKAWFQCRSCGQQSPLDGFDVDGTVSCVGCGLTQAFHVPVWNDAFGLAHGLADLGFPLPEGRHTERGPLPPGSNPFGDVGETTVGTRFETAGLEEIDGVQRTASLRADLALGLPFCDGCKQPLEVETRGGETTTRCTRCGTTARYRAPELPMRLPEAPPVMLLDELRLDASVVRTETGSGGAIAIRCPSCNAGLEVAPGHGIVVCGYCRTSCRIPSRTLHALRPGSTEPQPFWVGFVGPSSMRANLLAQADDARRKREASRSIEPLVVPELTREQQLGKMAVATLVLLLVGLLFVPRIVELIETAGGKPGPVGGAITPLAVARAQSVESVESSVVEAETELAASSAVVRAEWIALPGCGCPEISGGIELAYRVRSNPDATELEVDYALLSTDGFPTPLAATASTAPPSTLLARDLELGVSCSPTTVTFASHRSVSVFERRGGALLGNGPSRGSASEPERTEGPVSVRCARASVQGGRMRWSDEDGIPHEADLPET